MTTMRHFINILSERQAAIPLPTISFKKLWHVGSMDRSDKRSNSLEGAGLSVSQHPEAWKVIARGRVAGDTFLCTKSSNMFINAYACTTEQNNSLAQWGIENDYAEPGKVWTISYYDDHIGSWSRPTYGNKEDFERDWKAINGPAYPNSRAKFSVKDQGFASTRKLNERTLTQGIDTRHTLDMLLTVYAEDVLGIDGVWWKDRLSPENHSAPRGVIVPKMIQSWSFKKL